MSTPRTDKEQFKAFTVGADEKPELVVEVDFARTLETELQACHAVMEEMAETLREINGYLYQPTDMARCRGMAADALARYDTKLKSQKP